MVRTFRVATQLGATMYPIGMYKGGGSELAVLSTVLVVNPRSVPIMPLRLKATTLNIFRNLTCRYCTEQREENLKKLKQW